MYVLKTTSFCGSSPQFFWRFEKPFLLEASRFLFFVAAEMSRLSLLPNSSTCRVSFLKIITGWNLDVILPPLLVLFTCVFNAIPELGRLTPCTNKPVPQASPSVPCESEQTLPALSTATTPDEPRRCCSMSISTLASNSRMTSLTSFIFSNEAILSHSSSAESFVFR